MADVHSVSSEENNVSLTEHIEKVVKAFDSTIKLSKVIAKAQGDKSLKNGGKIKLPDETEVGLDDLTQQVSKIKAELRRIPRIVATQKKNEKLAKRAKNANRDTRSQAPQQYDRPLVEFFKSANLGRAADGRTRLQDLSEMALFFGSGVGNLTFGVSLFNVWGNIYKLDNKTQEIVLDSVSQRSLSGALDALKAKKQETIATAQQAMAMASSEEERKAVQKALEDAQLDLDRLRQNKIHNKDYMGILSFYRIKENPNDLSGFVDGVATMSAITKDRNSEYRVMIQKSREGEKTKAPVVAPVVPLKVAAPIPTLPSLKPTVPVVPTIQARGASPAKRK